MGNADPNHTKQENRYEVKPQYEERITHLIMKHAIINAMKCMKAIKDRIARPVYQLAIISIEPLYHAQQVSRWKSSVQDIQGPSTHHSSVVFRYNKSVGHHSEDSVGLFRHDKSVGQSQRGSQTGHQINLSIRLKIAPDMTTFFTTMSDKCYNAPELVKEDLLYHFGFSRKGVQLVGYLGITPSSRNRVIAMVWGGEAINRLTRARREVASSRQSLDELLEHHMELEKQLAELEAIRAEERRASEAGKRVLEAKKEALEAEKKALEAELADTRARAKGEIQILRSKNERLKGEAEIAWGLGKDEFLKSTEFDDLCAENSLAFLKCSFKDFLAHFRANGYIEEEHPPHSSVLLGPRRYA
ncbi:hypothetical protein F511_25162 [Dorcoceras hygrometricum]|uniref:Uncharacterized protein n=1 Tax=Dorcoceras hygrometricum TaxID=472368 RepID=A0A2Z7BJ24_9LAMI|nr:hypothetical protein F511_25162 [Dorcoceras hygrometricum]